ncbi:MAG TPA: prepilin-type N-terminal cleavage/methylation domain-containing protein [Candidatus Angelobacter sp.]|nr:prepilin-type N-terminal cleavage/methylation domain-containing protein [Candidatus Angelobacter sp.]
METSTSHRSMRRSRGFTLIEVMAAVFVLAFGLLAAAWLMNKMNLNTNQSRYMSDESLLASQKLEDLNRYPLVDPAIVAGGSLTADVTQTNTVGAVTQQVNYFDQVQISTGNGSSIEITTGTDSKGNANYTQIIHTPNGDAVAQTFAGPPPPPSADMLVFSRRWLIEQDIPVKGVRRVTVAVSLPNTAAAGPGAALFQTTMVRP